MVNKLTVVSVFAGCGGSSLGYQMAGFDERLAIEWDANAAATFRANFPGIPLIEDDIARISVESCLSAAGLNPGELDVLDGSPPCQGFSTAGRRQLDDPRNALFREYVRILSGMRPRAMVMENVTGMVKGRMRGIYLEIAETLRSCGYRIRGAVMNAMFFGVPQNRERVIIIGIRDDLGIEPSHPKPRTIPIPLKQICADAIGSRSQDINPWIPATLPVCTITKTPYERLIRTASGCRQPTERELSMFGSFPESFKFIGGKRKQWERIGNSVPPLLMQAIAEHVGGLLRPRDAS